MYGTLSFGKRDTWSQAEFHPSNGKRQRACDECRASRVKCRSNGDRCVRCYHTSKSCTYDSGRRTPGNKGSSKKSTPSLANMGEAAKHAKNDVSQDQNISKSNPASTLATTLGSAASSPQVLATVSAPESPDPGISALEGNATPEFSLSDSSPLEWWNGLADCPLEGFALPTDTCTDAVLDGCQIMRPLSPVDPEEASQVPNRAVNEDGGLGHNDLSTFCCNFSSQLHQAHHTMPSDGSPCKNGASNEPLSSAPTLADFSEFNEFIQFATPASASTTSAASNPCACLQDLTASLYSLRHAEDRTVQADHFLMLSKQTMTKLEAAERCPARCCISIAFAPLMLMNIQELVTLVLRVTLSLRAVGHARETQDFSMAVSIGEFAVEDKVDQRLIVQMLLAARIKSICVFITNMAFRMKLADLSDICLKINDQIEMLKDCEAL